MNDAALKSDTHEIVVDEVFPHAPETIWKALTTGELNSVAASEVGKASGIFNMLRYLGGAFGIAILVTGFAHSGTFGSAEAFSKGFALALGIAATLSFAGAIAGLGLPGNAAAAGEDVKREGAEQQAA